MAFKSGITALAVILSFSIILSGCNSDGVNCNQEKSTAAVQSVSNTKSSESSTSNVSSAADETKQTAAEQDEDFYSGLSLYETSFKLENYPVTNKSKYSILRAAEGCMTQQELESAGKDIDETVEKLEKYLDTTLEKEWSFNITYFIRPGEFQRVTGSYSKPVAFLTPQNSKIPMYAHETTHLLAGCKSVNSTWMVEGLAVYLNTTFSAYPTWPQYDKDIDKLAKERLENGFDKVINFEEETGYTFHDPNQPEGEAYYTLSGSFVKYIENKAGIKKYMAAYKTHNADTGLKNETGKTLSEWKMEWIEYLKQIKDS